MRVLPLTSPVRFAPPPGVGPAAGDWAPTLMPNRRSRRPTRILPPPAKPRKRKVFYTTCLLDLLERFPGDWMWIMRLDLQ
jgi:hypothetical protein